MAAIFGESKIFWKLPIVHWLDTLWVENFYETRWLPKVAKIEMFQIHIEYSSTTIWVKNSVEIALSLTVSEILTFLGFPQKSKMAAKSGGKIEIFQFCIGYFAITLWVKNSVEIALSLTVSEILTFSVFRKNPRWPPKVAKIKIFQFCIEYFATTLWVKNSVQIALSLTVSEILIFFVFHKNSRWPPKVAKIKFFNFT